MTPRRRGFCYLDDGGAAYHHYSMTIIELNELSALLSGFGAIKFSAKHLPAPSIPPVTSCQPAHPRERGLAIKDALGVRRHLPGGVSTILPPHDASRVAEFA